MRIGIFDSGVGGLTVLKELILKQPKNDYIYYGDTIHMPYGDKTVEELFDYSCKIMDFFVSSKVDSVVVACGTICSTVIDSLKEKYEVPIYSLIDVTIEYINHKFYNYVLVLATKATIDSHTYRSKLSNYGVTVCEKACPKLVPLIEAGDFDKCDKVVEDYIKEIKFPVINAVILGCTHYPIIDYHIKKHFSSNVEIINMGELFAERIKFKKGGESVTLYFSLISDELERNVNMILGSKYELISKELI